MKVVLDTNVLISAFLWHGRSHEFIILIQHGKVVPLFSEETLTELTEVLSRSKFKIRLDRLGLDVPTIVSNLLGRSDFLGLPKNLPLIVEKDPSDDKFLYIALEAGAEYIVSGDKHLLALKEFKGVKIVSVDEFLSIVG